MWQRLHSYNCRKDSSPAKVGAMNWTQSRSPWQFLQNCVTCLRQGSSARLTMDRRDSSVVRLMTLTYTRVSDTGSRRLQLRQKYVSGAFRSSTGRGTSILQHSRQKRSPVPTPRDFGGSPIGWVKGWVKNCDAICRLLPCDIKSSGRGVSDCQRRRMHREIRTISLI
jgi:hypothetical protein